VILTDQAHTKCAAVIAVSSLELVNTFWRNASF
jgi:hypothetical protein